MQENEKYTALEEAQSNTDGVVAMLEFLSVLACRKTFSGTYGLRKGCLQT